MSRDFPSGLSALTDDEVVAAFMRLFSGSTRAYGLFHIRSVAADGKVIGKAQTIRGAPGVDRYEAHLRGTGPGLGIIPIRDDGNAVFGAIDYDLKSVDHSALQRQVASYDLPLVVCRSKSGGAHLYLFSEPVPAVVMRRTLSGFRVRLGLPPKTEIFPKQDSLSADTFGNWINLPWYGALCR